MAGNIQADVNDEDQRASQNLDMDSSQDFDLSPRALRRNHLVTLAQANPEQFPDEHSFAAAMVRAFTDCGRDVTQWACCQEDHQGGGIHYHFVASIGGKNCQRYEPVVERFKADHGVVVRFTKGCSGGYSRGYRYLTKEGMGRIAHSPDHPTLEQIQERGRRSASCRDAFLSKAAEAKKRRASEPPPPRKGKQASGKPPRLSMQEVGDFVLRNSITTYAEFEKVAHDRRSNGDNDLFNFICRTKRANTEELITRMNSMRAVPEREADEKLTKMEKLERAGQGDCVENCDGKWRRYAEEILVANDMDVKEVAHCFKEALTVGRGKGINPNLVGPADCGKSFLVQPLEEIYKCFTSPTTGSFAWVELEGKEVIILNDLRWTQSLIPWDDFLRLLEGGTVQFRRPGNSYSAPLVISRSNSTAIFATGIDEIKHEFDSGETDMMKLRWKVFKFSKPVSPDKVDRKCKPCPRCFHDFVMQV